jgi:signal-transduction protein with cAMP-binding, CBS, and nucleotidyltransferase domain
MIVSSLAYEHVNETDSVLKFNNVSTGIYFVDGGSVKMYYKDSEYSIVTLEEGSYFGDISFIF